MKQTVQSFLLALFMSMMGTQAFAHDIEVKNAEGVTIYYNFINGTELEVSYRGSSYSAYSGEYSGRVVIPSSVAYNGNTYSVTSIRSWAFRGCSYLTSVTIPNTVTSIGSSPFYGCSGLEEVYFNATNCTSMGSSDYFVFAGCSALTKLNISDNVTNIPAYAFKGCSGLTSVTIPNTVTSIGSSAFSGCSGLTSVTIPNSVTTIEQYAFSGCSGLTSVTIPNSVTTIEQYAFSGCSGLTSVTIPNSVTSIRSWAFRGCSYLTSVTIPNSVTSIGNYAFSGCSGLTSINIPNSVTSIGRSAFEQCIGLTNVSIPNSVTSIEDAAFYGCSGLTSIDIPNSVTSIGDGAFYGSGLKEVYFNATNCTSMGSFFHPVFDNCSAFTKLSIGDKVSIIPDYAFSGCSGLTSVSIPNSVTSIGNSAFMKSVELLVNNGTISLLSLWNAEYIPFDITTKEKLIAPTLSLDKATQTSLTLKIDNMYDGYTYRVSYSYRDTIYVTSSNVTISNLAPVYNKDYYLIVSKELVKYSKSFMFRTNDISPSVIVKNKTASSVTVDGDYIKGDAEVCDKNFYLKKEIIYSSSFKRTGLDPNTGYNVSFNIRVHSYEGDESYSDSKTIYTDALKFTSLQPKVISQGNVIVAAESNLDDEETNVGFEWRRTDWTDDFPSNTGQAFLYEGQLEGYIRNLNTEKLWKFRPYYESASGNRYYGEWMGLDPTNTSYFEPTVHTYAKVEVQGNTANVRGYAMRGSDNITSQGFMYWKQTAASRSEAPTIPSSAQTVTAKGNVMEASLTNLDYETTYCYVAFATTAEGETFYGDQRQFTTGEDVTRIEPGMATTVPAKPVAYYDLSGRHIDKPQQGLVIVRMSDGTTRKMVVKK